MERSIEMLNGKASKRAFLRAVSALAKDYVGEAEHQDGSAYWKEFKSTKEAVEDFLLYLPFELGIADEDKPNVQRVYADWKDMDGLVTEFEKALKRFGISMADDPDCEGSDTYGFILSSRPLTDKELEAESIFNEE